MAPFNLNPFPIFWWIIFRLSEPPIWGNLQQKTVKMVKYKVQVFSICFLFIYCVYSILLYLFIVNIGISSISYIKTHASLIATLHHQWLNKLFHPTKKDYCIPNLNMKTNLLVLEYWLQHAISLIVNLRLSTLSNVKFRNTKWKFAFGLILKTWQKWVNSKTT